MGGLQHSKGIYEAGRIQILFIKVKGRSQL